MLEERLVHMQGIPRYQVQGRRQRALELVLYQHCWRIHCKCSFLGALAKPLLTQSGLVEDQDSELRVESHPAVLQVELVPDTADLLDLRGHQDHRLRFDPAYNNQ